MASRQVLAFPAMDDPDRLHWRPLHASGVDDLRRDSVVDRRRDSCRPGIAGGEFRCPPTRCAANSRCHRSASTAVPDRLERIRRTGLWTTPGRAASLPARRVFRVANDGRSDLAPARYDARSGRVGSAGRDSAPGWRRYSWRCRLYRPYHSAALAAAGHRRRRVHRHHNRREPAI